MHAVVHIPITKDSIFHVDELQTLLLEAAVDMNNSRPLGASQTHYVEGVNTIRVNTVDSSSCHSWWFSRTTCS